jgi:hypothetical protein
MSPATAGRSFALPGQNDSSLRVDVMVLARESDANQTIPMETMIQRGCSLDRSVPGCDEMHDAGLDPFDNPHKWGATVTRSRGNRSVLLMRAGTLFFYWMGSAAMLNSEEGENLFTNQLIAYIERFRPRRLIVPAFTRLVRSAIVSGDLLSVLVRHQVSIQHPGGLIEPWTPIGQPQWMMHVMFASMERNEIVTRNLIGIVAGAARGICPWSGNDLPFGYRLAGKTVIADGSMAPKVRRALLILADPSLSYRDAALRLGKLGLRRVRSDGEVLSLGDHQDPQSLIKSMLSWLELYETGVYTMRRQNPLPGITHIGALPVIREHPGDDGYLDIPFQWGLPQGGWCETEVFAAIRARLAADADRAVGGSKHGRRKPFAGFPTWDADGYEWKLDTEGDARYRIRRRTVSNMRVIDDGREGWADSTVNADVVARFLCQDLHAAVANAAVDAISNGVDATLTKGWWVATEGGYSIVSIGTDTIRTDLEAQIHKAESVAGRARSNANAAEDDELAAAFLKDARAAAATVKRLRARLADLDEEPTTPEETPDKVQCDAWHIARALAHLSTITGVTEGSFGDAIRTIISDLRFTVDEARLQATFSFNIDVPAEEGILRIGPITGALPATIAEPTTIWTPQQARNREKKVLELWAAGRTAADITWDIPETRLDHARRIVAVELERRGIPRKAANTIVYACQPVLQRTIWNVLDALADRDLTKLVDPKALARSIAHAGVQLDDDVSPEFAAHLLCSYLPAAGPTWNRYWNVRVRHRQHAVDHVAAAGGTMQIGELAQRLLNDDLVVPRTAIVDLTRPKLIGPTLWSPVLAVADRVVEREGKSWRDTTVLSTIRCLHCGGPATRVRHLPEIPGNLLCDCGRMPIKGSPLFPASYMAMEAQVGPTKWPQGRQLSGERSRKAKMRRLVRIDELDHERVINAYCDPDIAILGPDGLLDRFNISHQTLYGVIDRHGVKRRMPRNRSRTKASPPA